MGPAPVWGLLPSRGRGTAVAGMGKARGRELAGTRGISPADKRRFCWDPGVGRRPDRDEGLDGGDQQLGWTELHSGRRTALEANAKPGVRPAGPPAPTLHPSTSWKLTGAINTGSLWAPAGMAVSIGISRASRVEDKRGVTGGTLPPSILLRTVTTSTSSPFAVTAAQKGIFGAEKTRWTHRQAFCPSASSQQVRGPRSRHSSGPGGSRPPGSLSLSWGSQTLGALRETHPIATVLTLQLPSFHLGTLGTPHRLFLLVGS